VRVVSLVPSITETLLAWRVPVVACTRFCEQPTLPTVGGTKDPDVAAIVALAPDLVVADREENRRDDAEALSAAGLAVHVTHVTDVGHVATMLRDLAAAVGVDVDVDQEGGAAVLPSPDAPWATALVPIWRRPWMVLGPDTYGATLLSALGVRTVPVDVDVRYPELDAEAMTALQPDLVVLPSEPYPFTERHVAEVQRLLPSSRVVLVDGRDLLWWGVRTPVAIERLRAVLRALPAPR
jgi:ABC-type hemin transport system substrate-binding protein